MENNGNHILSSLNQAQKEAVMQMDGPVMVLAGAGSGKTRVLTYRVAYLIQQGIDPFRVLALTFTNKAAREMKDRIHQLIGGEAKNVWMGTFHSIFARILRYDGHLLNYPSHFTIYDTEDSRRLIKKIIKQNNLDDKIYKTNAVHHRISSAKNGLISYQEYRENEEFIAEDKSCGQAYFADIYKAYDKQLFQSAAMDFDDLLFNTYRLLDNFPEVLLKYQRKFQYILVDEFQDTNVAQYLILKKLAANNENICVVGDDAQSIYAFRGANIQNILGFKKDYPDVKVFKLEQNYRSTKTIVAAANSIIVNNKQQIYKSIWTDNSQGNKIKLLKANSDTEEGTMVAGSIFEIKMNLHVPNDQFAILYRTNAQSRSLEEALRKLNIPYRIYGGLSFYKRKEIKDLLAYFRFSINHQDEDAFLRIINYPTRGIGLRSIEKLNVLAAEQQTSLWELLEHPNILVQHFHGGLVNRFTDFANMIKHFEIHIQQKNAFESAEYIAKRSGLLKKLNEDKTPEGVSRVDNIEELLNAIKEFCDTQITNEDGEIQEGFRTLDEFLQESALLTDADEKDKDDTPKVSLMTVHAAKGLEFPYVYVTGLEENLFPSHLSLNTRADLEEERRLFYVATTRAEQMLTLSYAEYRYKWGDLAFCEPSRFIDEIDEKYIDYPKKYENKINLSPSFQKNKTFVKKNTGSQSKVNESFEASDYNDVKAGMDVKHSKFGNGKVVNVEGMGPNKKALVYFEGIGEKQLLLKFAKLKIL